MNKKRLSKSDIKRLNERLLAMGVELSKKDSVDVVIDAEKELTFFFVNGEPRFFEFKKLIVPHLKLLLRRPDLLNHVTVDMGAVRFVVNGADIMRPGVRSVEDGVKAGALVVIVDETHGKPLAVGEALLDAEGIWAATEGKVVKNLHWIGDKVWNLLIKPAK